MLRARRAIRVTIGTSNLAGKVPDDATMTMHSRLVSVDVPLCDAVTTAITEVNRVRLYRAYGDC